MSEILSISLICYFLTLVLAYASFFTRKDGIETAANLSLQCSLFTHCVGLGWLLGSKSPVHLSLVETKLSLVLLFVMVGYLVCQAGFQLKYVMGFYLILPLTAYGIEYLWFPESPAVPMILEIHRSGNLGLVHGIFSLVSLSVLTLSFVSSILYLLMEYRLERKKFDFWFHRLPALNSLELMSYRTTLLGFLFLTLSILTGTLGHHRAGGMFLHLAGHEWLMILVWLVYILFFQVRFESGMVGGKLAKIALIAYLIQCVAMFFLIGRHPF